MPLEIKEIVVKANVTEVNAGTGGGSAMGIKKEMIIAECVEQILEILNEKKER